MSQKLERILNGVIRRLTRNHVAKGTCLLKQNSSCLNVPHFRWSESNLCCRKSVQSCGFLYKSHTYYSTNANETKKEASRNNDKLLVYYGLLTSKIKTLKVVSYTTSICGLIAQPVVYDKVMSLGTPGIVCLYAVMGFSTFVTPVLIHHVTKKYITEIKYDPSLDVYILKTLTFFLQDKIVSFTRDEVQFNTTASLFNSLTVKGKPYILFQEGILVKDHYIKLLGFDKPIDLKLGGDPIESESSNIKSGTYN